MTINELVKKLADVEIARTDYARTVGVLEAMLIMAAYESPEAAAAIRRTVSDRLKTVS